MRHNSVRRVADNYLFRPTALSMFQVMTSFVNTPLVGMEPMKSYSGLSSMCTRQYRSPQIIKYFTKDVDTPPPSSTWVCTIQPQFDVISSYMLIESFCSESIGKQPYIRNIAKGTTDPRVEFILPK